MRRLIRRMRAGLVTVTGTGAGASAVLGLLVLASVFVSVVTPRASLAYRTKALRQLIAATPPSGRAIIGSIDMPTFGASLGPSDQPAFNNMNGNQFGPVMRELAGHIRAIGAPISASANWWSAATGFATAPGADRNAYFGSTPPEVELIDRSDLGHYAKVIAGRMPAASNVSRASARFEVAVTSVMAVRFRLRVGSVVGLANSDAGSSGSVKLVVTAILRPVHLQTAFWTVDANALQASLNKTLTGEYWLGGMFVADGEFNDVEKAFTDQRIRITWVFPMNVGRLNANQAVTLNNVLTVNLGMAAIVSQSVLNPLSVSLQSPLTGALTLFVQTAGQLGTLLSLLYVSLTVVGVVVLLLGARLLAERRAAEFGLIRARGAARRQLALLAARAGAVVVIPAAVLGAALAVAVTANEDEPLGWWLGAITMAAALAGVPWLVLRRVSGARALDDRADAPAPGKIRVRRIVFDIAAVLAAIGGLTVLRLQTPPVGGGTDWYTSAAPVLVAIPAAIVVVRVYPVVLRWFVGLLGRRSGVTTFVGLARATRTSITAVLPAFALVLALAVIAFGAMLRTAVVDGDVAQSWRQVGADVVIDTSLSNAPLTPATQRAIAAVPGVRQAATIAVTSGSAADGTSFGVVVVTPGRYAALLAQTPAPAFPAGPLTEPASGTAGRPVPVLASPGMSGALASGPKVLIGNTLVPVSAAGKIDSTPGVPQPGPFIVMPAGPVDRAMGADQPSPNLMLLIGPVDHAKLTAVVDKLLPGATTIAYRSSVLSALTDAALPHGAYETFAQAAIAAAGFGAVIMLIMLALGARPRELTLARLFTMGLSPRQARSLVIAEALPAILAATVGGAICAWVLVPLIGPSIDLSPFTGATNHVSVRANFAVIGYIAAGLVLLAFVTLFTQAATTRLRGVARALRVGE
jgi:putative ABC transport system permease protein